LGWGICFFGTAFLCAILLIGSDLNNLPKWKVYIGTILCKYGCMGIHLSVGITSHQQRVIFDYSKWLGPDQRISYEGAGINICNHLSAFDISAFMILSEPKPGFIAKYDIKKLLICFRDIIGILFIKRNNSASLEEREEIVKQITDRQIAAEQGKSTPLTIFPEGGTSNGKYIVSFKRGAFQSLRAVKPHFVTYKTMTGINMVHGDAISAWCFYVMIPMMAGVTF
jgi:lysophosphatidylcholine acyltransferase/lyso-PAF acetyltransferase